jgi:chromosome segregation ATPase
MALIQQDTAPTTDTYKPSEAFSIHGRLEEPDAEMDTALLRIKRDLEALHHETAVLHRRKREEMEARITELELQCTDFQATNRDLSACLERERTDGQRLSESMEQLQARLSEKQQLLDKQIKRHERLQCLVPRSAAGKEPLTEAVLGQIEHLSLLLGLESRSDLGRIAQAVSRLQDDKIAVERERNEFKANLAKTQEELAISQRCTSNLIDEQRRQHKKLVGAEDRMQQVANRWQSLCESCDGISDLLIDAVQQNRFHRGHGFADNGGPTRSPSNPAIEVEDIDKQGQRDDDVTCSTKRLKAL